VPHLVKDVFRLRAPPQIISAVVHRVSVQVPALHAVGPWFDERFQNKSVDADPAALAGLVKVDVVVTPAVGLGRKEDPWTALHVPAITSNVAV